MSTARYGKVGHVRTSKVCLQPGMGRWGMSAHLRYVYSQVWEGGACPHILGMSTARYGKVGHVRTSKVCLQPGMGRWGMSAHLRYVYSQVWEGGACPHI